MAHNAAQCCCVRIKVRRVYVHNSVGWILYGALGIFSPAIIPSVCRTSSLILESKVDSRCLGKVLKLALKLQTAA